MNLETANILITGGAGAFGRALTAGLCETAKQVIVVDRNPEALNTLFQEFPRVRGYCTELTDAPAVEKLAEQIYQDFGSVNVLINNAGIIHSEPLVNMLSAESPKHRIDNWLNTLNINLNAVFFVTVNIASKMVRNRNKGVIINISSISSYGNAGQSAYAASKAALNALTVTWSKELGMFGIRSVAIAPGFIDTHSTQEALTESKLKTYKNMTPLGRLGKTEELLHAVKFVIENDFYNGSILNLDGGLKL